jgi:hypothetical protein
MRYGHLEEVHFSVAFSPVPDETTPSGIGGVLATVHEITENVVDERRVLLQRDLSARSFEARCAEEACMRAANTLARHSKSTSFALLYLLQRDLGVRSSEAKTVEEACKIAANALAHYSKDVPFALLYLIDRDRKHARLASASGIAMGQPESQFEIALDAGSSQKQPWPLAQAFHTERMQVVENLQEKLANVPPGPWSDPPTLAVVCPMRSTSHQLAGLLVLGVSSRLRFDERYRDFCELVAGGVATAIAHVRADDLGAEKGQMILSGF